MFKKFYQILRARFLSFTKLLQLCSFSDFAAYIKTDIFVM